ncbi:MAG: hypothetical protein ACYDEV_04335 [Acidiferrobacter sp.]
MKNQYDQGIFDTIREHNAIAINGETETRQALDDAKKRFDYANRMEAWGRQKRKTWIPLILMIIGLKFEWGVYGMGDTYGVMGGQPIAIFASLGIVVNLAYAWILTYALLSRGTGVSPGLWNLVAFAAIPGDKIHEGVKTLLDFDHYDRHEIIRWIISVYVAAAICLFASQSQSGWGGGILMLGFFIAPFFYMHLRKSTWNLIGAFMLFPEHTVNRLNKQIEAAWRKDPENPIVSRRSAAGRGVLSMRRWLAQYKKKQGGQGGTSVRAA